MHRHLSRLATALALVALVAGCSKISAIQRPAVQSGTADLSRYVALGTSLAAGYESDGLAERHQPYSYANQFARLTGASPWDRCTIDADGSNTADTGPMLNLLSLTPPIIATSGHVKGTAGNQSLPTDYHNLGVPGALLVDVADSSAYYGNGAQVPYHSAHFAFVARHRGTLLMQMARLQPTFITFEYGANEILGGLFTATHGPLFDVPTWSFILHGTLDGMQALAPSAKVAIMNVPDPTDVPFARTFSWITRNDLGVPTPLLADSAGVTVPLRPGSLVLLTAGEALAAGDGFPTDCHSYVSGAPGTGQPLAAAMVMRPDQVALLQAAVNGYNTAIATEAAARSFALVDLYQTFKDAAANGLDYNGHHYSTAFLTGGLFSIDGIHPSALGYGLITNALISAVNLKFGAAIAPLDYSECLTTTSYRLQPVSEGRMPYVRDAQRVYAGMFPIRSAVR
jgi:hypothetical protein